MTNALPPQINLPHNPERRSVADMVSLWESKCQSPAKPAQQPVVKSGVSNFPASADSFEPSSSGARPTMLGRSTSESGQHSSLIPSVAPREMDALSRSLSESAISSMARASAVETGSSEVSVPALTVVPSTPTPETNPTLAVASSETAPVTSGISTIDVATSTEAVVPASSQDVEKSKPLNGGAQLVEAVTGKTGIWAGLKALTQFRFAEGLSNIVRGLVTLPFAGAAALLDAPRKVGDIAADKGKALVLQGENQGGLVGALKTVGGGFVQAAGGVARLAQPIAGMALMASAGPVGWGIGAVLLGMFVIKELSNLLTGKTHEMQSFKAVRDVVSGAGAIAGGVVETIVNPLKSRFGGQMG